METEELTCESCKSIWTRQKSRGRKPKVCPSCVPVLLSIQEEDEDLDNQEDIILIEEPAPEPTKYKPGTKWRCNSCLVSIKIGVGHNDPPTHSCKKRLKKIFPLERV